jgi:8-oxo-dGTP diphosphatase
MKRFNIRIYGLWLKGNEVLVSEEIIKGTTIVKFPGGGLEWGEGTIEGLKREWQEELGIEIRVLRHYYTTDYFQKSAWDESQVVSIYYLVEPAEPIDIPHHNGQERFYFVPADHNLEAILSLPIDKTIARNFAGTVN